MVRDEVLRQLGRQLPPEMQLLEAAVAAPDALAREVLLQRHARLSTDAAATPAGSGVSEGGSGGAGDGDGGASLDCLAADLERAASQVISDMELMPTIPDRCVRGGVRGRTRRLGAGHAGVSIACKCVECRPLPSALRPGLGGCAWRLRSGNAGLWQRSLRLWQRSLNGSACRRPPPECLLFSR